MKVTSILFKAIWGFGGLAWNILNLFIALYPEMVRESAGDKFIEFYGRLPLSVWGTIAGIIFAGFFIYEAWQHDKSKKTALKTVAPKQTTQNNSGGMNFQDSEVKIFVKEKKRVDSVPKAKNIVYQMGLILDTFDKKFESVRHSKVENGIATKFNDAKAEIYKLYDDFLPQVKSILKNSDEIEEALNELHSSTNLYQAILESYVQQENAPYDSVYMKTGGLENKTENAISLRTNNGEAYSGVRKSVSLLRKELKKNL